jgi:carboxypeptidase C (cathepsin A)
LLISPGNWFGGEAISLAVDYTHKKEFSNAGYAAMVVDGTEYGEVRQYGNFSFARIYESGHEIPYYQRESFSYFPPRIFANGTFTSCRCLGLFQPHIEQL